MNPDTKHVLVDTSAWIVSFRGEAEPAAQEFLRQKLAADQVATARVIILELVQGCKSKRERDSLRLELESLAILELSQAVWERAYSLAFDLRRKGLTIPSIDVIVTALALEDERLLLHYDRHFELVATHVRELQTMSMKRL